MTEERGAAGSRSGSEPPDPERYYAEPVSPASGSLSVADLQEVMNEGSRKSWRLVSVVNEPAGQGVILIWDQQGFFSG